MIVDVVETSVFVGMKGLLPKSPAHGEGACNTPTKTSGTHAGMVLCISEMYRWA